MSSRQIFLLGFAAILVILVVALSGSVMEHLDADELMVVQSPISGTLTWYTDQGMKGQWFGKVTKYPKRFQYWFSADKTEGNPDDQSINARFNDNGHGKISGSISILLPLDEKNLNLIHKAYGSSDAMKTQLVRPIIEKAVYMTGPLMSSRESASEKRNYLIQYIEDQIQNGVYQTYTEDVKQPDPITGEMKTVSVVKLRVDANNQYLRQDKSPLNDFGVKTYNLSIKGITYEAQVEAQMQQQQVSIMQVQTAIAKAKQAEQDAITAQKNGEAEAAKAKWDQEVIKAKEVTAAQQRLEVATKDALAAEQTKRKNVLEGEGEASKRSLIMNADGGLDKKIEALSLIHI
jgi:regulator of protease activity HflC (stomatin/prohibitin superfamily)